MEWLNLLEIFEKGGPVMYVIVLCSLIAMTVAIERWLFYRQVEKEDVGLMPQLRKSLEANTVLPGTQCDGPLGRIWHTLAKGSGDRQARNTAAEVVLFTETLGLDSRLYMLATIGTIAPLLGLLGTVLGMIKTFHTVSLNGVSNPNVLAAGISEALYNTAGGLLVTVPCIIGYNFFRNRSEQLSGVLEARLKELTALLARSDKYAR